jgi:hypothetical protein
MTGMSSLRNGVPVQGGVRVALPVGVTGGIFVGGRDTSLPTPPAIAPLEITVENADITELRIVVSTGK